MKPRHLLTILALSPQASSLHDAVNYPVDGNKGAADISIPLYTVPDPMAEKYYGINPYAYCAGDPVNRIDLYGSEWKTKEDKSIANNLSETITERQRALTLEKSRKENRLNKLINAGSEDKKVRRLEETIQSIDMQMATL